MSWRGVGGRSVDGALGSSVLGQKASCRPVKNMQRQETMNGADTERRDGSRRLRVYATVGGPWRRNVAGWRRDSSQATPGRPGPWKRTCVRVLTAAPKRATLCKTRSTGSFPGTSGSAPTNTEPQCEPPPPSLAAHSQPQSSPATQQRSLPTCPATFEGLRDSFTPRCLSSEGAIHA